MVTQYYLPRQNLPFPVQQQPTQVAMRTPQLGGFNLANLMKTFRQAQPMQQTGLLGTSFSDPRTQGVLSAASSLLQAGAPRLASQGLPGNIGTGIGKALQSYTATKNALEKQARDRQLQNLGLAMQIQQMQKPITVGKGEYLVNPNTFQPIDQSTPIDLDNIGFALNTTEKSFIDSIRNPISRAEEINKLALNKSEKQMKLRGEVAKLQSDIGKVINAGNRAQDLLQRGGFEPENQLEILYTFITALDPNSVVREGEVSLAREATALRDTIKGFDTKVRTEKGYLIPEKLARRLAIRIIELGENAKKNYAFKIRPIQDQVEREALNPNTIFASLPQPSLNTASGNGGSNPFGGV